MVHCRHAVPRPLHWPVGTRCPAVGGWVIAVRLSEVRRPPAATRDVHLPVQCRPGVGVHLQRRSHCCQNMWRHHVVGSSVPAFGINLPLSSAQTQTPRCWCVGRSAQPSPAHYCSPAPRWRRCGRRRRTRSGLRAAAAGAGWSTSCCDGGRTWNKGAHFYFEQVKI